MTRSDLRSVGGANALQRCRDAGVGRDVDGDKLGVWRRRLGRVQIERDNAVAAGEPVDDGAAEKTTAAGDQDDRPTRWHGCGGRLAPAMGRGQGWRRSWLALEHALAKAQYQWFVDA